MRSLIVFLVLNCSLISLTGFAVGEERFNNVQEGLAAIELEFSQTLKIKKRRTSEIEEQKKAVIENENLILQQKLFMLQ